MKWDVCVLLMMAVVVVFERLKREGRWLVWTEGGSDQRRQDGCWRWTRWSVSEVAVL